MTNEKKARDISQELEKYTEECRINLHLEGKSEVDVARENAYAAAIEMAEWKDQQFKQILQVIYSKTLSIEKDVVIEQIYKKLFGEDLDSNELEKGELKNILEKIKTIEL